MFDLNVPWPINNYTTKPTESQLVGLKNTIVTLYALGYTHIAINFTINEAIRIPVGSPEQINPINIEYLTSELVPKFPKLKLFTRLTLIVSDPAKLQGLAKIQSQFDILAVQPVNEKALQLCTTNLDIDLISFNFATKLPFFLKHKTIGSAVEKGIKFEICYSTVVSGSIGYAVTDNSINVQLIKKNFFNNVLQLIRSSRSKGIVISSGASQPLQTRNGEDILTLLKTLGLDQSRAKACITLNAERVLVSGRLRVKSYKQTISAGNEPEEALIEKREVKKEPDQKKANTLAYKKRLGDSSSGRLLKKQRRK
ncbi:RNase P subunit p30-domain-containing protein [Scheffersomyces xylosifermentans]|uniref:RNase P subunit p30-domain-containing protein n=1 Tax=Scheffersomyces xylosifermentans TaxID=1304137 RepID=UPI00315CE670